MSSEARVLVKSSSFLFRSSLELADFLTLLERSFISFSSCELVFFSSAIFLFRSVISFLGADPVAFFGGICSCFNVLGFSSLIGAFSLLLSDPPENILLKAFVIPVNELFCSVSPVCAYTFPISNVLAGPNIAAIRRTLSIVLDILFTFPKRPSIINIPLALSCYPGYP